MFNMISETPIINSKQEIFLIKQNKSVTDTNNNNISRTNNSGTQRDK